VFLDGIRWAVELNSEASAAALHLCPNANKEGRLSPTEEAYHPPWAPTTVCGCEATIAQKECPDIGRLSGRSLVSLTMGRICQPLKAYASAAGWTVTDNTKMAFLSRRLGWNEIDY
jgi:hypothetical protein